MTIATLQQNIANALNGVESLTQGGCKAFAEDSLNIRTDLARQLQTVKGVAICILTPRITRDASGTDDGIPVSARVAVQCAEMPDLNRTHADHLTALDAAEIVMHSLDGDNIEFESIEETADEKTRVVIATAYFNLSTILTP